MTEETREARARELIRQVWLRNRPVTLERIAVVASALTALAAGTVEPDQRSTAVAEAHKLRGILGTYGFAEGSVLAEEAELALDQGIGEEAARALATRLAAYARTLEGEPGTT